MKKSPEEIWIKRAEELKEIVKNAKNRKEMRRIVLSYLLKKPWKTEKMPGKFLGIKVEEKKLPVYTLGRFIWKKGTFPIIQINERQTHSEKKATLAHELIHAIDYLCLLMEGREIASSFSGEADPFASTALPLALTEEDAEQMGMRLLLRRFRAKKSEGFRKALKKALNFSKRNEIPLHALLHALAWKHSFYFYPMDEETIGGVPIYDKTQPFLFPRRLYRKNTILIIDQVKLPEEIKHKLNRELKRRKKGIYLKNVRDPYLNAGYLLKLPKHLEGEGVFGTAFIVPIPFTSKLHYFIFKPERFSEKVVEYIKSIYNEYRSSGLGHTEAFSKILRRLGYAGDPPVRIIKNAIHSPSAKNKRVFH